MRWYWRVLFYVALTTAMALIIIGFLMLGTWCLRNSTQCDAGTMGGHVGREEAGIWLMITGAALGGAAMLLRIRHAFRQASDRGSEADG